MAGDFYTLGSCAFSVSKLEAMCFPPRVKDRIKDHVVPKQKTLAQMIGVISSVVIPFLLLAIFSNAVFTHPVLYLAGTSIAVAYFTLFLVANKHLVDRIIKRCKKR